MAGKREVPVFVIMGVDANGVEWPVACHPHRDKIEKVLVETHDTFDVSIEMMPEGPVRDKLIDYAVSLYIREAVVVLTDG